jgi:hypothetical protein
MQDYNFVCYSEWVRSLVSDIEKGTHTEDVWEQGAEENIWTKRTKVTRGWRKLHSKELHNLYSFPSMMRMIKSRMDGQGMKHDWEKKNAYVLLIGKLEGKRPFGKPRPKWVDNIKMDLVVIG